MRLAGVGRPDPTVIAYECLASASVNATSFKSSKPAVEIPCGLSSATKHILKGKIQAAKFSSLCGGCVHRHLKPTERREQLMAQCRALLTEFGHQNVDIEWFGGAHSDGYRTRTVIRPQKGCREAGALFLDIMSILMVSRLLNVGTITRPWVYWLKWFAAHLTKTSFHMMRMPGSTRFGMSFWKSMFKIRVGMVALRSVFMGRCQSFRRISVGVF